MTTFATVTNRQISTLRNEAATAGDIDQVRMCDRALSGSQRAIRGCVRAIQSAEAMAD